MEIIYGSRNVSAW